MSSANATHCRLLYTHPPACDTTYASSLGVVYDRAQYVYIGMTVITALNVWIQTFRVWRNKGFHFPLTSQLKIFICCNIVVLTLIVRAVDPFGFRDFVQPTIIFLAYDIGTSAIYSLLLVLVHDWLRVTLFFASEKWRRKLPAIRLTFRALHVVVWCQFLTFSVLQKNVAPMWVWQSFKLGVGAIVLACIIALQLVFGCSIYNTLNSNESNAGAVKEAPRRKSFLGKFRGSTTSPNTSAAQLQLQRKRKRIDRILRFMAWASFAEFAAMVFQVIFVLQLTSDRFTEENPPPPPEDAIDLVFEGIFDFIQAASSIMAVTFFRYRRHRVGSRRNSSRGSAGSNGSADERARRQSRRLTYNGRRSMVGVTTSRTSIASRNSTTGLNPNATRQAYSSSMADVTTRALKYSGVSDSTGTMATLGTGTSDLPPLPVVDESTIELSVSKKGAKRRMSDSAILDDEDQPPTTERVPSVRVAPSPLTPLSRSVPDHRAGGTVAAVGGVADGGDVVVEYTATAVSAGDDALSAAHVLGGPATAVEEEEPSVSQFPDEYEESVA